jgi:hypothetical protein
MQYKKLIAHKNEENRCKDYFILIILNYKTHNIGIEHAKYKKESAPSSLQLYGFPMAVSQMSESKLNWLNVKHTNSSC